MTAEATEATEDEPDAPPPDAPPRRSRNRRLPALLLLPLGIGLALYFSKAAPREQHVRYVLGDTSSNVTGVELEYVGHDGEVVRRSSMRFDRGAAPRIVAHDPMLTDGTYLVHIDVDAPSGRRTVERQIALSGGRTTLDLAEALLPR